MECQKTSMFVSQHAHNVTLTLQLKKKTNFGLVTSFYNMKNILLVLVMRDFSARLQMHQPLHKTHSTKILFKSWLTKTKEERAADMIAEAHLAHANFDKPKINKRFQNYYSETSCIFLASLFISSIRLQYSLLMLSCCLATSSGISTPSSDANK